MELSEFLLARIAEDEAAALSATPGPWYWEKPSDERWPSGDQSLRSSAQQDGGYDVHVLYGWGYDASGIDGEDADRAHIARWDPARVLTECEAKKTTVRLYQEVSDLTSLRRPGTLMPHEHARVAAVQLPALEGVLRLLALPYADHPDFRAEWKP